MKRVFVLGNATLDIIQRVRRLPAPGETLLCHAIDRCAGGKGLNQAVAAARAGAHTTLVAPVGADPDGLLVRQAAAAEDRLESRWVSVRHPTDLSCIWVADDGENAIVSSSASARSLEGPEVIESLRDLRSGDLLMMQGNLSADATSEAVTFAKKRGALLVLNTAPLDWDMSEILPRSEIVVANENEARLLTGLSPDQAAVALLGAETKAVVVTLGRAGAILAQGHRTDRIPALKADAIDTSGAGDVTVGTLTAFLARGCAIEIALSAAMTAAALSVTRKGTTPSFPTAGEMMAIAAGLAST